MWSCRLCGARAAARLWRRPAGQSLHITLSQPPEPPGQLCAAPSNPTGQRRPEKVREDLGECLALEIKIGACVAHCCHDAGMTEDLTDGSEIDPVLEHVNCGGMTKRVRVNAPP
jgi:hypothetical protein